MVELAMPGLVVTDDEEKQARVGLFRKALDGSNVTVTARLAPVPSKRAPSQPITSIQKEIWSRLGNIEAHAM
jgi:hypothetical protein